MSEDVDASERTTLALLPSYPPEFMPAERLRMLVEEPTANPASETPDDLRTVLGSRCVGLSRMSELVCTHTPFHSWSSNECNDDH